MASERQLSVALRYLRDRDKAPRVIAKGRGLIAEQIIRIARQRGIPVHRDTDLAEVLVQLDLDQLIPTELYRAVAEILSHLYRMNQAKS
ncbi:MAG: EscU/YscU/HrcU family type III secretion system export apparatus switch protein [Planctomycetota bacterium]|jgi:flagellar biosynthesis protein